jgi:hypothetical protein
VKIYKPLRVSKGDVKCKKSTIATSTQIISITESFLKPLIQSHKRNGSKANPIAEISNMYEVIVTISIARQIEFGLFC